MDGYIVDWQRRRLLHTGVTSASGCLHGVSLVQWCGACGDDLDAIAADMLPQTDTGSAA
jgi:hypothetical protein